MTGDAAAGRPMTVVGGTYRELCAEPAIDSLYGSGVRAAAILASLGHQVEFQTCVDDASRAEAESVRVSLGITQAVVADRAGAVTFSYATPVSTAAWSPTPAAAPLAVVADVIVAFGMIETTWAATGDCVVIDPQHGDLKAMLDSTSAGTVAVVLNAHEAWRLTGRDATEAGPLIRELGADVVVIKRGALGGLVCSDAGLETYGAIPTETVRPIGSGDAFTAGFAHAWSADLSAPAAAARFGAQAAAVHSLTGLPQISSDLLATLADPLPDIGTALPRVYLAAPFFTLSERLLLDLVRIALSDSGVAVFSPLHDVGRGGDEVARHDIVGLDESHAVLGLLDGADPGTVFETGWATKASIPVVGFSAQPTAHEWTMLRGTGSEVIDDIATAVYRAAWAAIAEADRRSRQ